jgi:hypothetical protein
MNSLVSFLRRAVPVLGVAVLLTGGSAKVLRADTCDDIGGLGDRWHRVADFIDKHSDDGKLRKADIAKVQSTARELFPPTKGLAKVLVTEFSSKNKDEARAKSLGKQLQANIDELSALGDGDDWDDVGEIITKIGDVLNKVSDLCSDGK